MMEQDIQRAVQYVTASTSYSRETVELIVRTYLTELAALATQSRRPYSREALVEYVAQWTIRHTGQPEPLVREVLQCAGRWLDQVYAEVATAHPDWLGESDDDRGVGAA